MKRVLVTGAGGQLGQALRYVAEVARRDFEWLFTDKKELDITDKGAVESFLERERPDVIVNCAAYTDVDKAEMERETAFRVNYDGARHLAEAASRSGTRMIHISTDYIFDGKQDYPYTESDIPSPINVYGDSKLTGARTVLESGCLGAVVRVSWLYSPWGRNFVKSILASAKEKDEIRVVGDQRSSPTSALSLSRAIIRLIPAIIAKPNPRGVTEVLHYCDKGVASRSEFAAEIVRQAGLGCRVVPITSAEYPSAAKRPAYSALDTAKITREFGIVPPMWKDALAECFEIMERDGC